MKHRTARIRHRLLAAACCVLLLAATVFPVFAQTREEGKTVRVGWYDSTFNTMDDHGRRSGYAYEYQMKIASYTGWRYEYVTAGWAKLLEMLKNGEIDLLSDVSYTEERAGTILYPSYPMGTEEYCLFTSPNNTGVKASDLTTLNGKRIGVNKDSIQADFYREWAEQHGVSAQLVEVTCSEDESLAMVEHGELDGYVTVDSFVDPKRAVPVSRVGSSNFYFAVSGKSPELLAELNDAMSHIFEEDRYYNLRMHEKYIQRVGAHSFLTPAETEWISEHRQIRVGYQDNYLAFCAENEKTGELTGVLKDYLDAAADCIANAHLDFVTVSYPTSEKALDALAHGEVDVAFPVNFSVYDAEQRGLSLTQSFVNTDIFAIVRESEQKYFFNKSHVIVAVNAGNPNYDAILLDEFPNWQKVYYETTADCLAAVSEGVADCVLVSNFRYNNIARQCDKLRLTTLSTGVDLGYCFAIRSDETEIYSIMAKTVNLVPSAAVDVALTYYVAEDAKITLADFIVDHLGIIMLVIAAVLLVIVFLLVQNMRAARRAKKLIAETETDELTGLYNRSYFFQYAERMFREHPEEPMDAIVLNIEQFHSVNALNGRQFGDRVLRTLGRELRAVADENGGIAGRFEADRFDVYCRHLPSYTETFDRLQNKLDELAPKASIRLRMGVMPWQPKIEPEQLFDRARTACTMARGHYKEHLIVFDEAVREREIFEQQLMNDLRNALDSFEFEVYYQPKFDVRANPPRLVSAEALVRWQHPELGMISPEDFVPLLEKSGQISLVDKYVWEAAAKQVARWKEQYGVTIPVSVNLSRVDVFDPTLESTLDGILQYNGLDRSAFKLEVTETAYTEDSEHLIQVVESLRSKGFQVEMDDFGTGYSSLSMLSAMPIDVLKMDRAFVRNIEHDERDVQLVALILDIAKNLKVPVVAEGVETEQQLSLLKQLGCDVVQGHYFSRPLHAAEFEDAFLRSTKPGQTRPQE